jgi:hypothetical protein
LAFVILVGQQDGQRLDSERCIRSNHS